MLLLLLLFLLLEHQNAYFISNDYLTFHNGVGPDPGSYLHSRCTAVEPL